MGQKTLIENTAITIGRLGLLTPARCSVFVPQFIRPWCASLQMIRDNEEKYTAFLGLVKMVYHNSAMLQEFNVFATFAIAVCSWQQPPPDLFAKFKEILSGVVDQMSSEYWNDFKQRYLPPPTQHMLTRFYQL